MQSIHAPKKPAPKDWHPADIQAALKKAGWTFRKLGLTHGYSNEVSKVLRRPWYQVEQLIASVIGVPAERIWPSRYQRSRELSLKRGRRKLSESNTAPHGRNVKHREAA